MSCNSLILPKARFCIKSRRSISPSPVNNHNASVQTRRRRIRKQRRRSESKGGEFGKNNSPGYFGPTLSSSLQRSLNWREQWRSIETGLGTVLLLDPKASVLYSVFWNATELRSCFPLLLDPINIDEEVQNEMPWRFHNSDPVSILVSSSICQCVLSSFKACEVGSHKSGMTKAVIDPYSFKTRGETELVSLVCRLRNHLANSGFWSSFCFRRTWDVERPQIIVLQRAPCISASTFESPTNDAHRWADTMQSQFSDPESDSRAVKSSSGEESWFQNVCSSLVSEETRWRRRNRFARLLLVGKNCVVHSSILDRWRKSNSSAALSRGFSLGSRPKRIVPFYPGPLRILTPPNLGFQPMAHSWLIELE